MSKIYSFLPSWCSAQHSIDKPENWDKMSLKEKKEYFIDHAELEASLCCQCSNEIDSDLEVNHKAYNEEEWWDESDFREKED